MKIKVDLVTGILLLIVSIIILLFPILEITNITLILKFLFISYAFINLGRYIFNRKSKDLEGLFSFGISIILLGLLFFENIINSPLKLALFIFTYVIGEGFVRLKKADYYHDLKEKIWILEITTLIIFCISGLLTSFSILLNYNSAIFFIGFLFFINGFIEIVDPITNLISNKKYL